jgi:hypothetical protein
VALPAHSEPRLFIQFRNHLSQTVGLLGRVVSLSQGRCLNTGQHKHRINARAHTHTHTHTHTHQTSLPWVGFDPTIPASERAKTVHALDRAATVIGYLLPEHISYYQLTIHQAGMFRAISILLFISLKGWSSDKFDRDLKQISLCYDITQ